MSRMSRGLDACFFLVGFLIVTSAATTDDEACDEEKKNVVNQQLNGNPPSNPSGHSNPADNKNGFAALPHAQHDPDDECEEDEPPTGAPPAPPGGHPAHGGANGHPATNCADKHPGCASNQIVCDKETYAIMMVMLCAHTCQKCEEHEHMPDSHDQCINHDLKCFKPSMEKMCHEQDIQDLCPWTCQTC